MLGHYLLPLIVSIAYIIMRAVVVKGFTNRRTSYSPVGAQGTPDIQERNGMYITREGSFRASALLSPDVKRL